MVAVQALAIIESVTLLMLYGGNALTPAICTGGRDGAIKRRTGSCIALNAR